MPYKNMFPCIIYDIGYFIVNNNLLLSPTHRYDSMKRFKQQFHSERQFFFFFKRNVRIASDMFNKLLTGLQKDLSFSQYFYCLDIFSNPNIREQDKSLRYSRRELHTLPEHLHSLWFQWGSCCSICLFLLMFCSSLFVLLSSLTIVLSVLLRFTASDYQFGIFKLFFL